MRGLFLLVPAIALVELVLHLAQTTKHLSEADWQQAIIMVKAGIHPNDGLICSPKWMEPTARMKLGPSLATVERMAAPDTSRFDRILEVSFYGKTRSELALLPAIDRKRSGDVMVLVHRNPNYRPVTTDLVALSRPGSLAVSLTSGSAEAPCPWQTSQPVTGNLGFGPAIPSTRASCSQGSNVGVTVIADLEYDARRCILVQPPNKSQLVKLQYSEVTFGASLVLHHGLYAEHERAREGGPITTTLKNSLQVIGKDAHLDGEGWKTVEFATPDLAGKKGSLEVEVSGRTDTKRAYCFDLTTR